MAGLALAKWPLEDRLMWQSLFESTSLLDDCGGLAHLRQTSIQVLEQAYCQWLGWLTAHDVEALHMAPVERATPERLIRWLDAFADARAMTRLIYLNGTLRVLRIAAPDADWGRQTRMLKKVRRLAQHGDPSRKHGRVLCSSVLLAAGISYAEVTSKLQPTPLERAARVQTGTMIALLAIMPLRCRTFRLLELGKSVHIEKTGILITVPGDLMKSGHPWEADVPEVVMPLLRRYLGEVRPWLMQRRGEKHDFLWVTQWGKPFQTGYLGARIAQATTKATGVRVSPHLFRDAAATTLARSSPESAKLIKPILAHRCLETAERHYIHAGSIDAGRTYAELIRERRKNL